jgi:type VI protein secretion system component Hcp
MNKQNSMIHPAANEQSKPIELSEQQLDNVTGGTKASLNLSSHCCTGKHIPTAVIAMRG